MCGAPPLLCERKLLPRYIIIISFNYLPPPQRRPSATASSCPAFTSCPATTASSGTAALRPPAPPATPQSPAFRPCSYCHSAPPRQTQTSIGYRCVPQVAGDVLHSCVWLPPYSPDRKKLCSALVFLHCFISDAPDLPVHPSLVDAALPHLSFSTLRPNRCEHYRP